MNIQHGGNDTGNIYLHHTITSLPVYMLTPAQVKAQLVDGRQYKTVFSQQLSTVVINN